MEVKPGYKKSDVGVIPQDWDVVQLRDLKPFVTSGSRGWAAFYTERGSLFVRITNLSRESIYLDLTDSKFVTLPPEASEGVRTQLKEHDVLISITADIGIVGYVDENIPSPAFINQHIALVRFDPLQTSGKFVSYFLASEKPQRLFRSSTDVGAKAGMSLVTIQKIQTALPPLPEQRAIATALSVVDGLLSGLDRLIAKKRDLKQAAIQQLLTGQTRLPGFKGEWTKKDIGDLLAKLVGGGTPSRQNPAYWNGDIPWVTVKDFATFDPHRTQEYITREGLKNSASKLIPAGTIITATRMALGQAIVYAVDVCINQDLKALFLKSEVERDFLVYWFELNAAVIDDIGSGSTVKGISVSQLRSLPIDLPPTKAEQTAIAEVLSDMDAELAAQEQRWAKTRALKQAMMQHLLTGRIRLV